MLIIYLNYIKNLKMKSFIDIKLLKLVKVEIEF